MDVASAEAVAGLVRAVGQPCAVITASGPRAKPVAEKGAICSVVFKIFFIKIWVVYNVVADSGIQQIDSVIHVYSSFAFSSIISYFMSLSIAPHAVR